MCRCNLKIKLCPSAKFSGQNNKINLELLYFIKNLLWCYFIALLLVFLYKTQRL